MLTFKEKLIEEFSDLSEEQAEKFYTIFRILRKEILTQKKSKNDWKADFSKISQWEDDELDSIRAGYNWKIQKF